MRRNEMKIVTSGTDALCEEFSAGKPPEAAREILMATDPVWADDAAAWALTPRLVVEARARATQGEHPGAAAAYFAAVRLFDELRRRALQARGATIRL
jgi:hypothetical protein